MQEKEKSLKGKYVYNKTLLIAIMRPMMFWSTTDYIYNGDPVRL